MITRVQATLAWEILLLPNRAVMVNPFALKEAMMRHRQPKQQNKDGKNDHK